MQDTGEEFIRWVDVERLGREPIVFSIVASDEERANLVTRLAIVDMPTLTASGSLNRMADKSLIELTGTLEAEVTQSCVISLEPVAQKIEEKFTVCYTFDKVEANAEDADYVVSLDEKDLPELILEGRIDVVQAIVEQIALAMDPYPRAQDTENTKNASVLRDAEKAAEMREPEVHKPFANLKDLMNKK
ncbi:MAG: DUF177 domain-containing protein [Sneathiella sp.]|nr:DUF177 domain-containing protein [Sneathiella sp.]